MNHDRFLQTKEINICIVTFSCTIAVTTIQLTLLYPVLQTGILILATLSQSIMNF